MRSLLSADQPARSDARQNRRRLLDAARALVLEVGGAPSRDAVARRAGVGIGTLYRHFPDRDDLLVAVVRDVLDDVIEAGEAALVESGNGGEALRRYLHATIDLGLGAVNILAPLLEDERWTEQRRSARSLLRRLVGAARRDGAPGDLSEIDVVSASVRFSRPLAMGLDRDRERAIAHRQLECYLDGLLHPSRR